MSRRDDALRLAELVGREGLVIDDPADGWPALGRVVGLDDPIEVALYVAPVGFSHRNRDDVERRFQNPGSDRPIELVPGALPVFIGIWEGDDPDIREVPAVLVTADPFRRVGRTTRFSVFPKVESLRIARATGIHVGETTTGEEIAAFAPSLLPAQVHAQTNGITPDEDRYRHELIAAEADPPTERQRRISSTLARANGFARAVRDAYEERCAMCGLGLDLIESAHILPVAAPGSVDEVRNGLALCANHHRAFDRHRIWVDPETGQIKVHPATIDGSVSAADEQWLQSTGDELLQPSAQHHRPDPGLLAARYRHFEDAYDWVR